MSENPLDMAFAQEQQRLEVEQEPVRREFDELARIVAASQTPNELGFGFSVGDKQIAFARGPYIISAELKGPTIWVYISQPEGSNYEQSMMGAVSSIYPDTTDATVAASHIGALMARIVENRLL